jgi:hypothetical protein
MARVAAVAGDDAGVAQETGEFHALDRRAAEHGGEAFGREREQVVEGEGGDLVAGHEQDLATGLSETIPRAELEADVAAVDALADAGAEVARDDALVLDRLIRDAAPRVDEAGGGEGPRRAGVEATGAFAAEGADVGGARGGSGYRSIRLGLRELAYNIREMLALGGMAMASSTQ